MLKNRIMIGAAALTAAAVPFAGMALSAGPAGAAKTKTISCTKMSGNEDAKVKLSGCNGNTGGASKKFAATSLADWRHDQVGQRQDDHRCRTHAWYWFALSHHGH